MRRSMGLFPEIDCISSPDPSEGLHGHDGDVRARTKPDFHIIAISPSCMQSRRHFHETCEKRRTVSGITARIKLSRVPYWGMAVYRTTYKDPKAWEVFLGLLQRAAFIKHDAKGDHRFRVFEDGALEGVGLQEVQRRFARERAAHRDAPSRQARLALWNKGLRPAEPGVLASGAESSSSSSSAAATPKPPPQKSHWAPRRRISSWRGGITTSWWWTRPAWTMCEPVSHRW
ncbi:hypothetical protein PG997_014300 [Apiospora hydei]|uniref:Uncharacterized protein n=1 Tax=Apiospora hydei TaxID=1337664 RepID=A0ABR1UTE3_9PEZI